MTVKTYKQERPIPDSFDISTQIGQIATLLRITVNETDDSIFKAHDYLCENGHIESINKCLGALRKITDDLEQLEEDAIAYEEYEAGSMVKKETRPCEPLKIVKECSTK